MPRQLPVLGANKFIIVFLHLKITDRLLFYQSKVRLTKVTFSLYGKESICLYVNEFTID